MCGIRLWQARSERVLDAASIKPTPSFETPTRDAQTAHAESANGFTGDQLLTEVDVLGSNDDTHPLGERVVLAALLTFEIPRLRRIGIDW